jgi:hypothetical protein
MKTAPSPLLFFVTRRFAAARWAIASSIALASIPWAVLGFADLSDYPADTRTAGENAGNEYAPLVAALQLALPIGAARPSSFSRLAPWVRGYAGRRRARATHWSRWLALALLRPWSGPLGAPDPGARHRRTARAYV